MKENVAIYAITKNGLKQAKRLKQAMPFADVFSSKLESSADESIQPLTYPLADFVEGHFHQYSSHIFICATGVVMRMIAPLMQDKRTDPAVVCLDEQAQFAISLLSGHRGGANALAHRVAHLLNATPVITTASDVSGTLSADMMGAAFGWSLDPVCEPVITAVSSAIVNDEPVLIVQESGEKNWWPHQRTMPRNLVCHSTLEEMDPTAWQGTVVISDHQEPVGFNAWQSKAVLWRPKSLVLGIGCDRNTPLETLHAGLAQFLSEHNLAKESIAAITSIDLKADEKGLIALSQAEQWPFVTFAAEDLNDIEGIENPSEYVRKVTGSNTVAEGAAIKQSGTNQLLVPKWTFKANNFNMTIACCRHEYSEPLTKHSKKNWYSADKQVIDVQPAAMKQNAYGNEVVEGYQCKPKHVDLNRPMLYHRHHVMVCEGGRCAKQGSKGLAHTLRGMIKELGLSEGDKRIKISRTQCVGACRNRASMVIYERLASDETPVNNGLWLRKIEDFSEQQWKTLFLALQQNQKLDQLLDAKYLAPVETPSPELINRGGS